MHQSVRKKLKFYIFSSWSTKISENGYQMSNNTCYVNIPKSKCPKFFFRAKLRTSTHLFQSGFSSTTYIFSLPDYIKLTNELTWQSQIGLSQPSQPSKQLIPHGQSKISRYNHKSELFDVNNHLSMRCFLLSIGSNR